MLCRINDKIIWPATSTKLFLGSYKLYILRRLVINLSPTYVQKQTLRHVKYTKSKWAFSPQPWFRTLCPRGHEVYKLDRRFSINITEYSDFLSAVPMWKKRFRNIICINIVSLIWPHPEVKTPATDAIKFTVFKESVPITLKFVFPRVWQ